MPDAVRQRITVPFNGHVIGEGFNSDSGERVGTGLDVGQVGEDQQADGQIGKFSFNMVTSQQSLESSLGFSAELDARYGMFSGGAKFDFAEKNAVNSSSTYIVASCRVINALRFGRNLTANAAAQRLLTAGDLDGFKRSFGDRFCQALQTGGEFYAVVRITSSNTKHQSTLASKLHGEMNGFAASGSFKAAFDLAMSDNSSHSEVNIEIFQMGGQGEQVQMPGADADKIRDLMNRFATSVHAHPVAFEAQLVTYDTLALAIPSPEDLADRRQVLEDCLARKKRYWSAISELNFLQTPDAALIFTDLPSAADLTALQNEFRRVLGALMTHARAVSTGAVPATPFVPDREPLLPQFTRRASTTFAAWWARREDPLLVADELTLINKIAQAAAPLMTVPLDAAPPQAVQNAVALLDALDLKYPGVAFTDRPPLRSLAALPQMIASPLRSLSLADNQLTDLAGVETFTRLESINAQRNTLRNVAALAPLVGLNVLNLMQNDIQDLTPIAGLTQLETLMVAGNAIRSLEALRNLSKLNMLLLGASLVMESPPRIIDNPITDATGLRSLPAFANPFVSADRVQVRLTTLPPDWDTNQISALAAGQEVGPTQEGVATRVGASNSFDFVVEGAPAEPLTFVAGVVSDQPETVLMATILLPARKKFGRISVLPQLPLQSEDRAAFAKRILPILGAEFGWAILGIPLDIIVEAKAL